MPIRKLPEVKCSWVSFFRRPGCGSKCGIWGHIHGVLCPNHPEPLHPTHSSPQAYLPFPPLHLALLLFIHQSSDSSSTIRLNNLKVNGCHGPQGPPQKKTFARWRNRAMKPLFCRCTKRCDSSTWENAAQAVPVRLLVQEIACGVSSYVFSIFQCISKHPLILDKSGSEELLLDV